MGKSVNRNRPRNDREDGRNRKEVKRAITNIFFIFKMVE